MRKRLTQRLVNLDVEVGVGAVAGILAGDGAVGAGGELAVKAFLHHIAHGVAETFDADAPDYLVAESVAEHSHSCACADAASLQIEERLFVELADGGSVGALDIVVVDLEEGAGVHVGLVG